MSEHAVALILVGIFIIIGGWYIYSVILPLRRDIKAKEKYFDSLPTGRDIYTFENKEGMIVTETKTYYKDGSVKHSLESRTKEEYEKEKKERDELEQLTNKRGVGLPSK